MRPCCCEKRGRREVPRDLLREGEARLPLRKEEEATAQQHGKRVLNGVQYSTPGEDGGRGEGLSPFKSALTNDAP